jgi:hypothetical protein
LEKDNIESYFGAGLIVAGFVLALVSLTGVVPSGSWYYGYYSSTLYWVIAIIAVLLFVTGACVLIFKSNE